MKMKKILSSIIASAMIMSTMTFTASAADTLPTAVDGVITLTEDVILASTLEITDDVTIDLAGYKITSPDLTGSDKAFTPLIKITGADVTFTDSADTKGAVIPGEKNDVSSYNSSVDTIEISQGELTIDNAVVKGQLGVNTKYPGNAIKTYLSDVNIINESEIYGGISEKRDVVDNTSYNYNYEGNSASSSGKAIYSYGSDIVISDSKIYGGNGIATGTTTTSKYISGGANFANGGEAIQLRGKNDVISTLTATDSIIKGGDSDLYNPADAISIQGSSEVSLDNCTVTGGSVTIGCGNYGIGGDALYLSGTPTVNVADSTIVAGTGLSSTKNGALEIASWSAKPTVVVENSVLDGGKYYAIGGSGQEGSFTLIDTTVKGGDQLVESNTVSSIMVEGTLTIADDSANKTIGVPVYSSTGADIVGADDATEAGIVVAKIGDEYYLSLDDAVTAIENGKTSSKEITILTDLAFSNRAAGIETNAEDVVFDLNGNTLTLGGDHVYTTDVTFKNGTIAITDEKVGTGVFWMWNANNTLTFENISFVNAGDSINACGIFTAAADSYGVTPTNDTGDFVFINSTIDLKNNTFNPDAGANLFYFQNATSNVTYNGGSITIDSFARGLQYGTYDIDDAVITMSNLKGNGVRRAEGTVTNTKFSVNGSENGIKLDSATTFTFDGTSEVTLTGATDYDIVVGANASLVVEDDAVVSADETNYADGATVEGNVVSKADTVYIQYKKTDIDGDVDTLEGSDTYDIVLASADEETIHELASADITFNFVGTPVGDGAMSYTVLPKEGVTLTQIENRYMFNYDGVNLYEESGNAIVIGTLTVDGFGKYTLQTADVTTNAVYATEIRDNIVDGFTPAAGLEINKDMLADDGMVGEIIDVEIAVPERELTINITFPNAVEYQAADYQDMTVTIVGGNIDEEIALGDNAAEYTIVRELPYNSTYTVTVSGAGYRTARYSVTLTEDKTLNFWNNVMDNALEVEEGKATSAVVKNFLAGDIVKDNNINIYDLSAVVSYFGTENCVADYPEYAKYDLNRDGVIDSKDVAYVLVSWGE